ncbi:hypothetical protein MN608_07200 [Microdochium nivale]|nr:hypothetical protein MN608_07200 [Microdochium nivale]
MDDLDFLADHALQARLFKISTEQQSLLCKDDAWTVSPSNIPSTVLEHVRAHLQRQKATESARDNTPVQAEDPPGLTQSPSEPLEPERFDSQPPDESSAEEDSEHDKESERPPDTQSLPWSSSPLHHLHPPGLATETLQDDFITQLPDHSLPQPTALGSSKSTRPSFDYLPSSIGQDDDDEMEMEIPTRLEVPSIPLNRTAVPVMATPPSAQIVPCSLEPAERRAQEPSRPKSRAEAKQIRYAPVAALYRSARNVELGPEHAQPAAKSSVEDIDDYQPPDTFPADSSSIIPSTHQASSHEENAPERGLSPRVSEQPMSSVIAAQSTGPHDHPPQPPAHKRAKTQTTKPSDPLPPAGPAPIQPAAMAPNTSVSNQVKESSPFTHFCATYKTYTGNTQSFVTACIYIQLQHKKIRSSLYDDFIRAWHVGYYAYVRKCDSTVPPVAAMHAYAWYNEMDDDPIYTSRVVTKQNLELVLQAYPDEVRHAQRSLGIALEVNQAPVQQEERPTLVPKSPKEAAPPSLPPPETMVLISDGEEEHNKFEKPPSPGMRSPECIILEDSPAELPPLDFSKSMSEIDLRRHPTKRPAAQLLARSHSEAGKHKRKASVEIAEKCPKKVSVPTCRATPKMPPVQPAPPSPSQMSIRPRASRASPAGSTLSLDYRTPTSTDAKRRRFADNPDKRAENFKKFLLKKRKAGANESIMSSAPTSAQRHG